MHVFICSVIIAGDESNGNRTRGGTFMVAVSLDRMMLQKCWEFYLSKCAGYLFVSSSVYLHSQEFLTLYL